MSDQSGVYSYSTGRGTIEAVKLGASIVHGPHVFNFTDVYEALDGAGGARHRGLSQHPPGRMARQATVVARVVRPARKRALASRKSGGHRMQLEPPGGEPGARGRRPGAGRPAAGRRDRSRRPQKPSPRRAHLVRPGGGARVLPAHADAREVRLGNALLIGRDARHGKASRARWTSRHSAIRGPCGF